MASSRDHLRAAPQPKTGIKVCSVADALKLAEQWSEEQLACRSGMMRHQYKPFTAVENPRLRYIYAVVKCECGVKKHVEMSTRNGAVLNSWMSYPPGYLAKGKGRILGAAQDAVRLTAVRELFNVEKLNATEAKQDSPRPSTLLKLQGAPQ